MITEKQPEELTTLTSTDDIIVVLAEVSRLSALTEEQRLTIEALTAGMPDGTTSVIRRIAELESALKHAELAAATEAKIVDERGHEIERLNSALRYEQHRAERIGTHGPGCWRWGPQHYECALAKIEALQSTQDRHTPQAEATAKNLKHCAIVVSDWLAGGCDVNDIPRPHIAALVTWTKESLPSVLLNTTAERPS